VRPPSPQPNNSLSGWFTKRFEDAKQKVVKAAQNLSSFSYLPPEVVGQMIIQIMETREPADFDAILKLLNLTVRWDADPKTDPSSTHKLRWTLRVVSGMALGDKTVPLTEAQKEEAVKTGIKRIEDFGKGNEYFDSNRHPQKRNEQFLSKFHLLLKKYGIINP
jgi:hypothetical protein